MGRRFPPRWRGNTKARFKFQRQRAASIGWGRTAWVNTSAASFDRSIDETLVRGKLCWGPRESTTVSSSAAAWSSKSNDTQKRLRSARPRARLIAAAERGVQDELRPFAVVEAAFDHNALTGGQVAQRRQPGGTIRHHLLCHVVADAGPLP